MRVSGRLTEHFRKYVVEVGSNHLLLSGCLAQLEKEGEVVVPVVRDHKLEFLRLQNPKKPKGNGL